MIVNKFYKLTLLLPLCISSSWLHETGAHWPFP